MKRQIIFLLAFLVVSGSNVQAQKPNRIAYIDMEFILANVPEYQEASAQLEQRVQQWKTELEKDSKKVEAMRIALEQERPLLTKELIEEKEAIITFEESKIAEYQQKRFGTNGDFILQKKQLIQPIQDQVFNAIQEIGVQRNYDFIFDRTSNIGMVFSAEKTQYKRSGVKKHQQGIEREQLASKDEISTMEVEEGRSVEEDAEITEKQKEIQAVKNEREAFIENRKKEREEIRAAKQAEFDARRAKVLEERNRKIDSIENIRKLKAGEKIKTDNNN